MNGVGKNLEGRAADGKFPLLRYLGESDHSIVFLTEREIEPRKAAIKLVPANTGDASLQISRWEAAAKLLHPHLIRLFEAGRCQIDNVPYSYVVMEYAEENLYQILPDRPLSAAEALEMLPPVLQAVRYLHGQGFVHGHIKPANILASGDQVKISCDGIIPMTQAGVTQTGMATRASSLYNPPEAATAGLSPAGDVWSLGVTIVEALTQHRPRLGTDQATPQSLPAPFQNIVRNCLRPRPEQRWFVDQIAAELNGTLPAKPVVADAPAQAIAKPVASAPSDQPTFAKRGRLLVASLFAVVLFALVAVKLWRAPARRESTAVSVPAAVQPSSTAPHAEPTPAQPAAPVPEIAPPVPTPPTAQPESAGMHSPDVVSSEVVERVLPTVPKSASRTIQGTIRVKVRVTVDASGNVSSATVISAGPSSYFARLALEASRKWKFAPGNDSDVRNTRILKFEFRQSGVQAALSSAAG